MGKAKPVDKANRTDVISVEQITNSILVFRGHKVLLDSELATLYGVTTGRLNEAVKRNQASNRELARRFEQLEARQR